ncbi:MAG: flagellar basal-body MS-ring/collar protein FliF [Gammaproteobacteria bacterium]
MGALDFWSRLGSGSKVRFALAVALIVSLTAVLAWHFMRTDYAALFTQLSDSDAASIVEQLRRQKVPYVLADGGATIEVPADQVHETRLRLMSSGVPLAGGVGFEIFDKQGLGVTEQSQRVSYQRALQGELARTIGALEDVKQARIHLVLPESTLFRRDRQEARAAITLTLRPGASLSREQVLGVQRLVAASVSGLNTSHVVITDQRGITLSGSDAASDEGIATGARLEMKRDIEDYVTRKVARLLDSAFGPGQALVSADVALNFDEIRRTVQELQPSGVRRRRQVVAGSGATESNDASTLDASIQPPPSNSSTDVEYEYGRRVEQVIAAPGGITRLSVGVVVPGDLDPEKQKRVTDLVRMAAGINEARGDAIVVLPLDQVSARPALPVTQPAAVGIHDVQPESEAATPARAMLSLRGATLWAIVAVVLVVALILARTMLARARRATPRVLSLREREALLLEIHRALDDSAPLAGQRAST